MEIRVFSDLERRGLTPEAQSLAYRSLFVWHVPYSIVEKALSEALFFGRLNEIRVDAPLFAQMLERAFDRTALAKTDLRPGGIESVPYWAC